MFIEVQIVNAFIDGERGGNPAGVVVDANGLTAAQKLHIAQQVGLSETAFVSHSNSATRKLEFFTPTKQIAHCGHATVATFSLLRQMGLVGDGRLSKETIDGNRDILVAGEMAFMEQRAPRYTPIAPHSELGGRILASLELEPHHLWPNLDLYVVNTGNSFLLIPLFDEQIVANLQPQQDAIEAISEELDLIGYYAFSTTTKVDGRQAGARMFAPRFGIPEESGTGMAAGPLACFLYDYLGLKQPEMLIEQGWLMPNPSPSVIKVVLEFEQGQIVRLMAGGIGKTISAMTIEI